MLGGSAVVRLSDIRSFRFDATAFINLAVRKAAVVMLT